MSRRIQFRRRLSGIAVFLLLTVPASGGTTSSPTPSALPPLVGDALSFGRDINNEGFVVGDSRSGLASGEIDTAVVWGPDRVAAPLPRLDPDTETFGRGINSRGEIVGISRSGSGPCSVDPTAVEKAVRWDARGLPMELRPLPGDVEARAFAINDNGVAVGRSVGPRAADCSTTYRAVVWDRDGNPAELATSLAQSFAEAINEGGDMVGGEVEVVSGQVIEHALVWDQKENASTILPVPVGALRSFGAGINNLGMVVGSALFAGTPRNVRKVVLWDRERNSIILQPLPTGTRGSRNHENPVGGGGINNRGTAVGWSRAEDYINTAVVWDDDGIPTALPPLPGYAESFAYGINDPGQIVGTSQGGGLPARGTVWR